MIYYSSSESQVTGLKIGRGEVTDFNAVNLPQVMFKGEYDILKLKVDAGKPQVFDFLNNLSVPYHINSILLRNSHFYKEGANYSAGLYSSPFYFEPLNGNNVNFLDDIFLRSTRDETGVVYPSWIQDALIKKEVLNQAALQYARSFAEPADGKMGWLIKHEHEYIGYNLGRKTGTEFEGVLIGVLPEYRNKGAASQVYKYFIGKIFPDMGITRFFNDVQIQNLPSLKSTFRGNAIPSHTWINVNLFPLISYGKNEVVTTDIKDNDNGFNLTNEYKAYTVSILEDDKAGSKKSILKIMPEINNGNKVLKRNMYCNAANKIIAMQYGIGCK